MICVDLPIYQAKARKAQKFNAAPKVGPGFPLGVEPPRASANEPPRKTLTRRSWSVWLVTSSCCALCGDLVATTVRYLESAMRGGGGGVQPLRPATPAPRPAPAPTVALPPVRVAEPAVQRLDRREQQLEAQREALARAQRLDGFSQITVVKQRGPRKIEMTVKDGLHVCNCKRSRRGLQRV